MPTQDDLRAALRTEAEELPSNIDVARSAVQTSARRRIFRRRALAWTGSIVALAVLTVGFMRLTSEPARPVVGSPEEQDAIGPVRIERWLAPGPDWVGVVEGIDPNMQDPGPARLFLIDPEPASGRGVVALGVSAEVVVDHTSGDMYVISSAVSDGAMRTFLTAIDGEAGTIAWGRQLSDVWQRRLPRPAYDLQVTVDGQMVIGVRSHVVHAWSTRDGSLLHTEDVSERCPELGDVSASWNPGKVLVTCGNQIVEFGLSDGSFETMAVVVGSLAGQDSVGRLDHLTADMQRRRAFVVTADGRVARVSDELPAGALVVASEAVVPDGQSSLVAPALSPGGDFVVVPLRGPGDCPGCAGRAAANWLAVVDAEEMTVATRMQLDGAVSAVSATTGFAAVADADRMDLRVLRLPSLKQANRVANVGTNPTSVFHLARPG